MPVTTVNCAVVMLVEENTYSILLIQYSKTTITIVSFDECIYLLVNDLFKHDDRDWPWQLSCIPFPVNLPGPRGWLSQVNIPAERAELEQLQKHLSAVPSIVQLPEPFGKLS